MTKLVWQGTGYKAGDVLRFGETGEEVKVTSTNQWGFRLYADGRLEATGANGVVRDATPREAAVFRSAFPQWVWDVVQPK